MSMELGSRSVIVMCHRLLEVAIVATALVNDQETIPESHLGHHGTISHHFHRLLCWLLSAAYRHQHHYLRRKTAIRLQQTKICQMK